MGTVLRKLKLPNKNRVIKYSGSSKVHDTLAQKLSIKAMCIAKGPITALWTEPRAEEALPSKRPMEAVGKTLSGPTCSCCPCATAAMSKSRYKMMAFFVFSPMPSSKYVDRAACTSCTKTGLYWIPSVSH